MLTGSVGAWRRRGCTPWARWRWWYCCSACPRRRASPKTFSATSSSCTGTASQVRAAHAVRCSHFSSSYVEVLMCSSEFCPLPSPSMCFFSAVITITCVLPLYPCRKGCETSLAILVRQPLPGHWGACRLPVHPLHSPVPSRSTSAQPALPLRPAGPQSRGGLGQSLSSASHAAIGGRIQM